MSLSQAQNIARGTGIGGSEIAAVLGVSPWEQAVDVFYRKRPDLAAEHGYQRREVAGDHVDFGCYVEEPVARLYEKRTGNRVRRANVTRRHASADWLVANIDRKVEGQRRGLEIKSVNSWWLAHLWGPDGTDEVPEYYYPQVAQYMLVCDYPEWDLAALIGGATDFRIYHLQRDPEVDDIILETSRQFWHENVLAGIPPAIDPHHKTAADALRRVFTRADGEVITLSSEAAEWHERLVAAKAAAKSIKAEKEAAETWLKAAMGNAGVAHIPGVEGGYVRAKRSRKAYSVDAAEYIDFGYNKRA